MVELQKIATEQRNPNTMNITVYAQGANIKVYTAPTTSSKLMGTVNGTTKLTCLAITDDGSMIRAFIEKPPWNRVVTNLVNTGIL